MSLIIYHPATYLPEREYIYSVILRDFLGIDYRCIVEERSDVKIVMGDIDKRIFTIVDTLFQTPETVWLTPQSLPKQPLAHCNLADWPLKPLCIQWNIPIIFGCDHPRQNMVAFSHDSVVLDIDIFGSAFFMLTRLEELVKSERDVHGRFPVRTSLAFQETFLHRPIVNEYVEILKLCLIYLWPKLQWKPRQSKTFLSHDVDRPLDIPWRPPAAIFKSAMGDLMKRKNAGLAVRRLWSLQNSNFDVNNTFDYIMQISEKHGLRSSFYFKAACTNQRYDLNYPLSDLRIRSLLRKCCQRGHEIGIHPSYETYQSSEKIQHEFQLLLKAAENEGIVQTRWGGRQHYLRWENPVTWKTWEDARIDYDATLGYAEQAGFRCGVCYEYRVYDLKRRCLLHLTERPLIAMDATLFEYMKLSYDQAEELIDSLAAACSLFAGEFTLLWHNDNLYSKDQCLFYEKIISKIS